MNGDGTPDSPRVPPRLADAYEQLRRAATESLPAGANAANLQGLGVLICKGMAAWMRACAAVVPSAMPATPLPVNDCMQVPPSAQRDVVDVLAAMALTITAEVRT